MTTAAAVAYGPLADEAREFLDAAQAALFHNLCTVPIDQGDVLIGTIDAVRLNAANESVVDFRLVGRQPSGFLPNETIQVPADQVIAGGTIR